MKVFNYLAKATYPTLILWAMYLYDAASARQGEEMSMTLLVLASYSVPVPSLELWVNWCSQSLKRTRKTRTGLQSKKSKYFIQ